MIHAIAFLLTVFGITGYALFDRGAFALLDYQAFFILPPSIELYWWALIPGIFWALFWVEFGSKILFIWVLLIAYRFGIILTREIWHILRMRPYWWHEALMGIFFLIHPFAYERLLTQPIVYLGILLLGYMLIYLLRMQHTDNLYYSIGVGIFGSLSLYMLPHAIYMIILIYSIYALCFIRSIRRGAVLFLSGICILASNAWWILSWGASEWGISLIEAFWSRDMQAFMGNALYPLNALQTHILWYGFWGSRYENTLLPVTVFSSWWHIGGYLVLLCTLLGFWLFLRKTKQYQYISLFWILGVCSIIFGLGIASPLTTWIAEWMHAYIPFWQWYREPQKWIGLWMIVMGFGVSCMFFMVYKYIKHSIVRILGTIWGTLLIWYIWSPGTLFGFQGQLQTTIYPTDLIQLRKELIVHPLPGKVAIFPWHNYYGCKWTGRPSIADPGIRILFPVPAIGSDALEVGSILYSSAQQRSSQDILTFMRTQNTETLAPHNITHILAMKNCGDIARYTWLNQVCTVEKNSQSFVLYRCF